MTSSHNVGVFVAVAFLSAGLSHSGVASQQGAQPEPVTIPESATALEGIPTVRVDSTEVGTTRRVLNEAEADKSRLRVSFEDGQLRWTSRENRPLQLLSSGEFTYLSSDPGHYIRLTKINDRISYVEHVDSPLGSVTYWGELRIVVGR